MKIKVCGMKHEQNIREVAALEPDFIGFIFYPVSPRYVDRSITGVLQEIPQTIKKTGVFVNEKEQGIRETAQKFSLDTVQLHAGESPELCETLRKQFTVIKAFSVDETFDFKSLSAYKDVCDYFLFDTKTSLYGGSGNTFDWNILEKYTLTVPFFLSGGIDLEQADTIKKLDHPQLFAADINSRFESSPGMKDITKVKHFIHKIREAL